MKLIRTFLYVAFIVMSAVSAQAQKEDWLPVTPQTLQYKDVPGNKGASSCQCAFMSVYQ